jgi:hypothetical protein
MAVSPSTRGRFAPRHAPQPPSRSTERGRGLDGAGVLHRCVVGLESLVLNRPRRTNQPTRHVMITNPHTSENGSAPPAQGRTSNPQRKRTWRHSAILALSGGTYYIVAAPTTSADNAKVGWVYTVSTFWKGLGTLSGTADKFPGYWEYSPIGYGPFQMSVRATPK